MSITLPTNVNTANSDSAADDPKQMRADLLDLMQKFNTLLGQVNSLGILQPGDGVEIFASTPGIKDLLRVKLDSTSLVRGAAGIKVNAQGVKMSMLDGMATDTPGNSLYYGTNAAGARGAYALPAGIVLQVRYQQNATYTTNASGTTTPRDNTVPLNTEGVQFFSDSITLANAANKVRIAGQLIFGASTSLNYCVALYRGSTCIAAADIWAGGAERAIFPFEVFDAPGSTGPHTYSIRVGTAGGQTIYWNGGTAQLYGGTETSSFSLMEFV